MTLSTKRPSQREQLLREVRSTDEPKKRLNAEIEASLYRRIKTRAAHEDRTISEITRELWIEYLSTTENE